MEASVKILMETHSADQGYTYLCFLIYVSYYTYCDWSIFLLCGPLEFEAVFVAKIFLDLSPSVVNFHNK